MKKFIIFFLIFSALFSIIAFGVVLLCLKTGVSGGAVPAFRGGVVPLDDVSFRNFITALILYLSNSVKPIVIFCLIGAPIAFLGVNRANSLLIIFSALLLGGAVGLLVLRALIVIYNISIY